MSKRPRHYFESDGSYNERPVSPKPKPPERFHFNWLLPIAPQVEGRVSDPSEFERIDKAIAVLHLAGLLPGNRLRAVWRQADMKADRLIRRFAKSSIDRTP